MISLALTLLLATATVAPHATPGTFVPAAAPKVPLHTEYMAEVNKKGQVVRIEHGQFSKDGYFNEHTFGNVLQMWIRHPDGSAVVGLFRVTFDYDPKTKNVARNFSLLKAGGDWGDKPGAATAMINDADAQTRAWQQFQREQNAKLPSIDQIVGPTPTP
jgi:hypothetical protein